MIRAFSKAAAVAFLAAAIAMPAAVRATLEVDPSVLYAQMKDAYAKGASAGWNFRSQEIYLSTIFNAGRAYSLQYPNDPAYAELATLTVGIGTGLHYNPLTNHDGALWWVREAADRVSKHSEDLTLISEAGAAAARQLRRRSAGAGPLGRRGCDCERQGISRRRRCAVDSMRSSMARVAPDPRSAMAIARISPRRRTGLSDRSSADELGKRAGQRCERRVEGTGFQLGGRRQCANVFDQAQSRRSAAGDRNGQCVAARCLPDDARSRGRIFWADEYVDSRNREPPQTHQFHARLQLRQ